MPLLFALTTVLSTALGGVFALRHRDRLHLVLGFTAGVLLGLVALDLLPEVFSLASPQVLGLPLVMLAFVAGFLVLHVIERSVALHEQDGEYGEHHHPQVGLLSALGLVGHSFLDGVGIGIAFQANTALGVAVSIAVIGHDFADGLNTVTLMLSHGNSVVRARVLLVLDALAPLAGAASTLLFRPPEQVVSAYLGWFAGFLVYIATSSILPEAHSRHPSRLTLACTIGGVVFIGAVVALS